MTPTCRLGTARFEIREWVHVSRKTIQAFEGLDCPESNEAGEGLSAFLVGGSGSSFRGNEAGEGNLQLVKEARWSCRGLRLAVVVARFNRNVTERLLQGALSCLRRLGAGADQIQVVRVPGSFELAFAARQLAAGGRVDAVICLGALIRGQTDHYSFLAAEVTHRLGRVAVESQVPISFGVLTVDNIEQALARSRLEKGDEATETAPAAVETSSRSPAKQPGASNKGAEAALAAVEMANLKLRLDGNDRE